MVGINHLGHLSLAALQSHKVIIILLWKLGMKVQRYRTNEALDIYFNRNMGTINIWFGGGASKSFSWSSRS